MIDKPFCRSVMTDKEEASKVFTREAGATAFTRKRKPPVHGSPV